MQAEGRLREVRRSAGSVGAECRRAGRGATRQRQRRAAKRRSVRVHAGDMQIGGIEDGEAAMSAPPLRKADTV